MGNETIVFDEWKAVLKQTVATSMKQFILSESESGLFSVSNHRFFAVFDHASDADPDNQTKIRIVCNLANGLPDYGEVAMCRLCHKLIRHGALI